MSDTNLTKSIPESVDIDDDEEFWEFIADEVERGLAED
jgi:hypothetical protein